MALADAAVAVLTGEGHGGKIYELTGPRLLSFREVTAEIAQATGRELTGVRPTDGVDPWPVELEPTFEDGRLAIARTSRRSNLEVTHD